MRRMLTFRDSGAAVVFVSHNLSAVELMCQQVVWLDRGEVRAYGPTDEVLRAYLDTSDARSASASADSSYLGIDSVEMLDPAGAPTPCVAPGQPFTVRVHGRAHHELVEPVFVVSIRGDSGPLFAGNMHIDGNWPKSLPAGPFSVDCCFGPAPLLPGRYRIELKVKQNVRTNYFEPRVLASLVVSGSAGQLGGAVPHQWRISAPQTDSQVPVGPALRAH